MVHYTKISVKSPAAKQYGPNSQYHLPFYAFINFTYEK